MQAAISEKVGHFLQHMTTFVAGIIVAFTAGWDMTLVSRGSLLSAAHAAAQRRLEAPPHKEHFVHRGTTIVRCR